jgi:hypothetical protein
MAGNPIKQQVSNACGKSVTGDFIRHETNGTNTAFSETFAAQESKWLPCGSGLTLMNEH